MVGGWLELHIATVVASLGLFLLRWLGVLQGARWPLRADVRMLSVAIDTVLLTAGVGLLVTRGWAHDIPAWLWMKWILLIGYIVSGSWALRRARTPRGHALAGILALILAAHIVGTAIFHHPAGFWLVATGR
ncbi:MAG: SirB2 family protein [Pseudomonadota bacterium]